MFKRLCYYWTKLIKALCSKGLCLVQFLFCVIFFEIGRKLLELIKYN